jgi:hypothetical protein
MSRFIFVVMTLVVTVAGCNRFPDKGLQIAAMLPPDENCLLSADQEVRLLRGTYDIAYRDPRTGQGVDYLIAPLLQSYLISSALEFQGEQSNLQVQNFDITIVLPDGVVPTLPGDLVNPYRVSTSAVLAANEPGGDASQEIAAATGIPADYQDALLQLVAETGFTSIRLDIIAVGTTIGGFTQRSPAFSWPIDICEGCLESCAALADDATSCLPGQDVWPYCSL